MWGRQHYTTFDGRSYEFWGSCSYLLLHDADPTSRFQVVIVNDPTANYNATVKRKLKVNVDGQQVYLGQKVGSSFTVTVNNKPVTLPHEGNPKIKQVSYLICL